METREMFSVISGILSFAGLALYIRAIFIGAVKPVKASWIIWATITTVAMISLYLKGSINGQIVGCTIGNWGVVIALFHYRSVWEPSHKFYIAGAIVGIVLSIVSKDSIFALIASLGATLIGASLTFVSTWEDSSREYKPTWTIYAISCIFALLAIPELSVKDCIQPMVYALVGGVMMYLLFRPQIKTRKD